MASAGARIAHAGLLGCTAAARLAVGLRSAVARGRRLPPREGPLRILFVAKYPSTFTGTKYRLRKWGERLARMGHSFDIALPMSDRASVRLSNDWSVRARAEFHLRLLGNRVGTVYGAARYDVAVVHMSDLPFWDFGPPFVAAALGRIAGRVLLDIDDLPAVAEEQEARGRNRALVEAVDGLVVGNRRMLPLLPERPAWFVPTCVDPPEWPVVDRSGRSESPVLGWVGTPGNMEFLEPLAPVLAEACRKHGAKVRVICSVPPRLPGVPVEFVRWTAEKEVDDLLPMDVGLAPLPDGPVARCKCALKSIQYMAAGLPVVASPVGANADVVEDGVTGFHAKDPAAWGKALDTLLADKGLRGKMGAAGRAAVEAKWSFDAHEATFLDAMRGIQR